MAIYYMNVQIIGRSAGRSATGAAAYRAGERIHDERTGQTYDYTRPRGEIEPEILATADAPAWVQERERLWNQVEKAERRADAQVAREIVVAFPKELNPDQQRELIRAYVQEQFVSRGMVADVAIHRNEGNPHAHIMLTMREIGPEGFSAKKNREWNKPEMLEQWREQWAVQSNRALEVAGREERIDHRSLAEQGAERLPQVHLGPHVASLERRGTATDKGEHNRVVAEHNAIVLDLEKARDEKRRLEAQKVVTERYSARLKAGWMVSHAQALARLEFNQGGGPLTGKETAALLEQTRGEQCQIRSVIHTIRQEGQRLEQVQSILQQREKATMEVDRLKSPVATVKRWFSKDAREEFARAAQRLDSLGRAISDLGTVSEADFEQQRSRWHLEQTKVPALEAKAESLSETINLASTALQGFTREFLRESERARKPRERDVGYER